MSDLVEKVVCNEDICQVLTDEIETYSNKLDVLEKSFNEFVVEHNPPSMVKVNF